MIQTDQAQAEAFLGALFTGAPPWIEMRPTDACGLRSWHEAPAEAAARAVELARAGHEANFGVHPRRRGGGRIVDVVAFTCLYADFDHPVVPAMARVGPFRLLADVSTGRGHHLYLGLKGPPAAEQLSLWCGAQRAWIQHLGADRHAQDAARVLRVPGTWHQWRQRPVRLLELHPERRYDLAEVAAWLGARPKAPRVPRGKTQLAAAPVTVRPELTAAEVAALQQWATRLIRAGFQVQVVGGNVSVSGVCPLCLRHPPAVAGATKRTAWVTPAGSYRCFRAKCPAGIEQAAGGLDPPVWTAWLGC